MAAFTQTKSAQGPCLAESSDELEPADLSVDEGFQFVQSKPAPPDPAGQSAANWQRVAEITNARLFDSGLSEPMILLETHPGRVGYFRRNGFEHQNGRVVHQIGVSATLFTALGDVSGLEALVRSQCYQWRAECGPVNEKRKRGTPGYCDQPLARKMEDVGLMPTATGLPGGKKTGYGIKHYVIEGGPFDLLSRELAISGWCIEWRRAFSRELVPRDENGESEAKPQTRAKFTCPICQLNAWAKRSAFLKCGECDVPMEPAVSP